MIQAIKIEVFFIFCIHITAYCISVYYNVDTNADYIIVEVTGEEIWFQEFIEEIERKYHGSG